MYKRCNNIVSYVNTYEYVGHVTIFSWIFTTACYLVVGLELGLGLGLDLVSGWLVVKAWSERRTQLNSTAKLSLVELGAALRTHTCMLYNFRLSLSHRRRDKWQTEDNANSLTTRSSSASCPPCLNRRTASASAPNRMFVRRFRACWAGRNVSRCEPGPTDNHADVKRRVMSVSRSN